MKIFVLLKPKIIEKKSLRMLGRAFPAIFLHRCLQGQMDSNPRPWDVEARVLPLCWPPLLRAAW